MELTAMPHPQGLGPRMEPPKHSGLESACGDLNNHLEYLAATIQRLSNRLEPILRPSMPVPTERDARVGVAQLPSAGLTLGVRSLSARLEAAVSALEDIGSRIDL